MNAQASRFDDHVHPLRPTHRVAVNASFGGDLLRGLGRPGVDHSAVLPMVVVDEEHAEKRVLGLLVDGEFRRRLHNASDIDSRGRIPARPADLTTKAAASLPTRHPESYGAKAGRQVGANEAREVAHSALAPGEVREQAAPRVAPDLARMIEIGKQCVNGGRPGQDAVRHRAVSHTHARHSITKVAA